MNEYDLYSNNFIYQKQWPTGFSPGVNICFTEIRINPSEWHMSTWMMLILPTWHWVKNSFQKTIYGCAFYGLNVCVFCQFICWNCTLIKRWGLWGMIRIRRDLEGGDLMKEIMPLKESHEFAFWLSVTWSQWSATQKRDFTRPWPCWHLDLELIVSKTVRNKFMLFVNHLVHILPCSSLNWQR